jgi:hypothetical protein
VTINSVPWAWIESLTAADGTPLHPPERYTPLGLKLQAGIYSVVLGYPGAASRRCRLVVRAQSVAGCSERFVAVLANDFFRREGRTKGVPDYLSDAAQSYFDGDYARVEALLVQKESKKRHLFHALLFRGAARYGRYLLGGEAEPDLLAAATADLRASRGLRPSYVPHADFFSPRFTEFFSVDADGKPTRE